MRRLILLLIFALCVKNAFAQPSAWRDTLQAAVKTDTRRIEQGTGHLQTGLEGIRSVASPMGEGDPVRWAQGLPGVTTGADGTTAMYVRGGGMGNNLFSLDGVPVYGWSHILGLTTIVPTDVMESAKLGKGGFGGQESNFTSSHLQIVTKAPSETQKLSLSLNNFLASAAAGGPIGSRLSYIVSVRVSPLTWEYRAVRGLLPGVLGGLDNFSSGVGDAYGKLHWEMGSGNTVEASILGSLDRYTFDMPDASHEEMGWHNLVGLLKFSRNIRKTKYEMYASANRYGSSQRQDKIYHGAENRLSLYSSLAEYALSGSLLHRIGEGGRLTVSEGLHLRYAQFAPGQVGEKNTRTGVLLSTAWAQAEYVIPDVFALRAVVRGNYYRNLKSVSGRFEPDASVSARLNLMEWLSLELTGDRMMQYYHTLEGLPIGWSLDMMVPSGEVVKPEIVMQGNAGLTATAGGHVVSLGCYYKAMENLIYYKYAQSLFSGALASWEEHVDIGKGTSYGTEFMYVFQGKDLYARFAYTLSKTTRYGFAETNGGKPFHARFDRRHVLNASAQWKGASAALTVQSGHWENGAAETYPLHLPGAVWIADYYSGVNNYHMPTVFRLDLGYRFDFRTGWAEHEVSLGVCNVTNHFNPFMLYFDTDTECWKEIALLPIMPNFRWQMKF